LSLTEQRRLSIGRAPLNFALNEEINFVAHDAAVGDALERAFEQDLKYAEKLFYETWKARPWTEKVLELFTIPLKEQL
jgi:hypothetical protein